MEWHQRMEMERDSQRLTKAELARKAGLDPSIEFRRKFATLLHRILPLNELVGA